MTSGSHEPMVWSRRRVLQQTLRGVAGWATWHGWPSRQLALAQKGASTDQMTWAMHITLVPTWFDPAETGALITPDSTGFLRKCRFRLFSCGGAQATPAWTI